MHACGWRKADVRPDYNKPLPPHEHWLDDAAKKSMSAKKRWRISRGGGWRNSAL